MSALSAHLPAPDGSPSGDEEELELEPRIAATIPFVKTSNASSPSSPKRLISKTCSSPVNPRPGCLKTPLDSSRSAPARNGSGTSRPGSRRVSVDAELDQLSVLEIYDTGSRRPSALDILSHTGSEGAHGELDISEIFNSFIRSILTAIYPLKT